MDEHLSILQDEPEPGEGGTATVATAFRADQRSTIIEAPEVAIEWPTPEAWPNLVGDEVHVWAAQLDVPELMVRRAWGVLADEERDRALRFRFEHHRDRFIVGRGFLRFALGAHLNSAPSQIELCCGPAGKPFLCGKHEDTLLYFNLAHTEGLALLAVTRLAPVGVDVEWVRTLPDFEALISQFFSPAEAVQFRELPPENRAAAFFNLWTRKEAWLKATGEGITQLLNQVEVSFRPGERARLLTVPDQFRFSGPWVLEELHPAPGYAGALALASAGQKLRHFHWEHRAAEAWKGESW